MCAVITLDLRVWNYKGMSVGTSRSPNIIRWYGDSDNSSVSEVVGSITIAITSGLDCRYICAEY